MITADDLAGCLAFEHLTGEQRARIAPFARPVHFAPGTALFREGQAAASCWVIRTGRVALEAAAPVGGPIVVQSLGPGELIGWSWLVPPYEWHFDATATTPVDAIQLDTTALRAIAEADPALGYPLTLGLMQTVLARLQSTRYRLLDLYGSPRDHRN